LDDGSLHQIVKNFPDANELRETLAEGGTDIETRFLTYYWILTYQTRPA